MGRLVNVILPSGRVVAVDEEVANAGKLARPNVVAEAQPLTQQLNEERSSGIAEGVKAAGEGFADTATFGIAGLVHGALDPDYRRNAAIRAQERGGARFLGEVAGMALPLAGEAGMLGEAGAAVADNTAMALASRAGAGVTDALGGGLGAKVAGRLVEGGMVGAGTRIADTNVSGDQLSIEGMVEDAGVAGLLNVGQGALLDKVTGMTWSAKKRLAETAFAAEEQRQSAELAVKAKTIFDKDSPATPAYQEFLDKVKQQRSAALDTRKEIEKQAEKYADWTSPGSAPRLIRGAIDQVEKARNGILSDINATPYGEQVSAAADAHTAARQQYIRDSEKAMQLLSSTEKWPKVLDGVDKAINKVAARYDEATPISPDLDADLQAFRQRRSMITKLKDGGYRIDGGHWEPDPSVPPDPLGALAELHKLRDDFTGVLGRGEMRDFHSVKFPDIPPVPTRPPEFAMPGLEGDLGELPKMASAVRDLSDTAATARKLLRDGKYEDALTQLRSLKNKVAFAEMRDVVLPELPVPPPPYPVVPDAMRMPDSLRGFARMTPERLSEFVNQLDEPTKDAFSKVYRELDLQGAMNGEEAITATHRELGKYISAVDKLDAMMAKEGEGGAGSRLMAFLRRNLRASAQYGVARTADKALGHGWAGAVGRVFAGQAAGMVMGSAENAILGRDDFSAIGGIMALGREGFRMKITRLIAKYGDAVTTGASKLAPLTTHLATSFLTGDRDPERDPLKQAVNRIQEIQGLNLTARDTMYSAVEPLMGHPSDAAWKVHNAVVGALQHLSQVAPLDPGLNVKMGKSSWTPSYRDAQAYAARIEAVKDPMTSLERLLSGGGNPAAAETLWTVYPAMMNQAAAEIVTAANLHSLSMQQASAYSRIFRVPLTGFQQPQVISAIQGMYMQRVASQVAAGQQPVPQAPGRPARVRNRVAGSSVSALISQE